jgi:hypothetical protein
LESFHRLPFENSDWRAKCTPDSSADKQSNSSADEVANSEIYEHANKSSIYGYTNGIADSGSV